MYDSGGEVGVESINAIMSASNLFEYTFARSTPPTTPRSTMLLTRDELDEAAQMHPQVAEVC